MDKVKYDIGGMGEQAKDSVYALKVLDIGNMTPEKIAQFELKLRNNGKGI